MVFRQTLDTLGSILPYSLKFWDWDNETWDAEQIPDLHGKVAIVTGGNGGIGLEVCYELVRHGAHVFLGARSPDKFRVAQSKIRRRLSRAASFTAATASADEGDDDEATLLGQIEYLPCDLSTMRAADDSASYFLRAIGEKRRLDIFVACAGRGTGKGKLTEDGIEPLMATNCVNHMVMLRRLLGLIKQTAKRDAAAATNGEPHTSARIVFVSSVTHRWCSMPFVVPTTFSSWSDINDSRRTESNLYAQSKLAQILMIKRLNWEIGLADDDGEGGNSLSNVACIAIHPGEINNNFVLQNFVAPPDQRLGVLGVLLRRVPPLLALFLLNAREGARTCLFAATAREVDARRWRGVYVTYPCRLVTPSSMACDMALAQRCWTQIHNAIDARLGPL